MRAKVHEGLRGSEARPQTSSGRLRGRMQPPTLLGNLQGFIMKISDRIPESPLHESMHEGLRIEFRPKSLHLPTSDLCHELLHPTETQPPDSTGCDLYHSSVWGLGSLRF